MGRCFRETCGKEPLRKQKTIDEPNMLIVYWLWRAIYDPEASE